MNITIDDHPGGGYVLTQRLDDIPQGTDGRVWPSWKEAFEAAQLYRYAAKEERGMDIDAGYAETKAETQRQADAPAKKPAKKKTAKKAAKKKG